MNDSIEKVKTEHKDKNKTKKWELMQYHMIKEAKRMSKERANDREIAISQLSEKLIVLQEKVNNTPNEQNIKLLLNSQQDIEELLDQKMKGVIFRTKSKWHELGEVNSKFFYNLEKSRYNARVCSKLLINNTEITDPKEILKEQESFYKKLYTANPETNFKFTNNYGIQVPDDMKERHEKPLTKEELGIALKGLKTGKTPGANGLTTAFFKMFFCKFGNEFHDAVSEMFQSKSLTATMNRGIINLIPKSNRDTRMLNNMRPITLLDTSYKIIEKAIANRLQEALDIIIHSDQKGFMKGRRISSNIRKIFDLMKYTEENNLNAVILSLDFLKCFDYVEHSALIGALNY